LTWLLFFVGHTSLLFEWNGLSQISARNTIDNDIAGAAEERSMESKVDPKTEREWQEEFEAAARRPLEQRIKYAFIHTYRPVLDDAPFRSFDTMEEYRQWCEKNLPDWLGYGRV
jgi:hypothetical protein